MTVPAIASPDGERRARPLDVGQEPWANACAARNGVDATFSLEFGMYTDARSFSLPPAAAADPYALIAPAYAYDGREPVGRPQLGLVLRADQHLLGADDDDDGWDHTGHHGGNGGEERTALLSILLGVAIGGHRAARSLPASAPRSA